MELACCSMSLHSVPWAYMKFQELAAVTWACIAFSFMSLCAVPFFVCAAHKNFAVLVWIQQELKKGSWIPLRALFRAFSERHMTFGVMQLESKYCILFLILNFKLELQLIRIKPCPVLPTSTSKVLRSCSSQIFVNIVKKKNCYLFYLRQTFNKEFKSVL